MVSPRDSGVFHAGEQAVQERAGVRASAEELGAHMVQPAITVDFAYFLAQQSFVYLAVADPADHVWVTPLAGPPGFAKAVAADRVEIQAAPPEGDPVAEILARGSAQVGVLVLEAMTRSRIRLNGTASLDGDGGLLLELREVFGNCPKYIARRHPVARAAEPGPGTASVTSADRLDTGRRALVHSADTFFIGSRHPERGADASHRGGRPGFVAVSEDGTTLTFPEYQGNNMFQTLGNITADPAVGLLFIDWETGRTLQISGRGEIDWDSPRIAEWPRAQRLVDVHVEAVVDRPAGLPIVWEFVEASKVNPPAPAG